MQKRRHITDVLKGRHLFLFLRTIKMVSINKIQGIGDVVLLMERNLYGKGNQL